MRVAVTGANGLLGGEAVAQAVGAHEVLAIGRGRCRLPAGAYSYAEADLGDGQSVERVLIQFRPDAVLHAGAATDVDACERDVHLAWRVNVGGTAQVARASQAIRARLVVVSTDYVFDGKAGPYSEDDLPNPQGAYARTKRCGEEAALLLAPNCAVARVAVVYSGRAGAKPTFATHIVERLSRGEPVDAFSDQYVTTTLASNGAAMCLELLLETEYRGVLHASDATVLTRVEFAHKVAREFGLHGEIRGVRTADAKLAAPRPLRGGLRVQQATALLKHMPLPIEEALKRFHVEWRRRTEERT